MDQRLNEWPLWAHRRADGPQAWAQGRHLRCAAHVTCTSALCFAFGGRCVHSRKGDCRHRQTVAEDALHTASQHALNVPSHITRQASYICINSPIGKYYVLQYVASELI
eukprot:2321766-Amphidinium_carterae.1